MSIIKDFIEFRKTRKFAKSQENIAADISKEQADQKALDIYTLYFCNVGNFRKAYAGRRGLYDCHFKFDQLRVLQEMTPQEVKKYLRETYGKYGSDLPGYHRYREDSIRYFRDPVSNKVLPLLSFDDLVWSDCNNIEGISKCKSMVSSLLPERVQENRWISVEDLTAWEQAFVERIKGIDGQEKQ